MSIRKKLYIAEPHGMCSGVRSALETVRQLLQKNPQEELWVLHELVHNNRLTARLKEQGVHFADSLEEVPRGASLIFGAHGVSSGIEAAAAKRDLTIIDTTCPRVRNLQKEAVLAIEKGEFVLLYGHREHPEVQGVIGRLPEGSYRVLESNFFPDELPELKDRPCCMLSQTTVNMEDVDRIFKRIKKQFPHLRKGSGVCFATTARQNAVRELAQKAEIILILGAEHSSNSKRLCEIAASCGRESFLLDDVSQLPLERLKQAASVGLSSGASSPEFIFDACLKKLQELGFVCEEKNEI